MVMCWLRRPWTDEHILYRELLQLKLMKSVVWVLLISYGTVGEAGKGEKVKLSLCTVGRHMGGIRSTAPLILHLGTRWR